LDERLIRLQEMTPVSKDGTAPVPPSLSEHVLRVLREDILSGRLAPGERLTEAALIERTGVSRTPIREGLRRLEAEGLVTSQRGRGAFVTYRLSPTEADLIYECRLVLEPYLTRLACERMTRGDLVAIEDVLERFCEAVDAGVLEAGQIDAEYHMAIYEASGSELVTVLRGYWSRLQLELSARVYRSEMPRRFVGEHRSIYAALEQREPELAAERMYHHITHGREALRRSLGRDDGT
jgi:DNA-binding GntR family transcriptional regulator